jgi:hypothetical protein
MNIPAELKPFKHYLLQALQLGKLKQPDAELMSIYCLIAFVQKSYPKVGNNPDLKGLLMELMDDIAAKKKSELAGELFEQYKDKEPEFIKRFATTIWKRADNTDRAGKATRQTAKAFFASSIFFQCLDQYDCPEDIKEVAPLVKYAKFKTNDILKAIKAGRKPTPGPPGGEDAPVVGNDNNDNSNNNYEGKANVNQNNINVNSNLNINNNNNDNRLPSAPAPSATFVGNNDVVPVYNNNNNNFNNYNQQVQFSVDRLRPGSMQDALELAQYAVVALEEEDKERAIQFLKSALNNLLKK